MLHGDISVILVLSWKFCISLCAALFSNKALSVYFPMMQSINVPDIRYCVWSDLSLCWQINWAHKVLQGWPMSFLQIYNHAVSCHKQLNSNAITLKSQFYESDINNQFCNPTTYQIHFPCDRWIIISTFSLYFTSCFIVRNSIPLPLHEIPFHESCFFSTI